MRPYTKEEIYQICKKTREVSSDPYSLFVAYVLYALFEYLDEEFEFENEEDHFEEYWHTTISHKEFWDIIGNAADDFVSAVENHLQVDINGQSYTIRHASEFDKTKLKNIFWFNKHAKDGMCPVRIEYINNVNAADEKTFVERKNDAKENQEYFRSIVYATDKLGKYDELTDIEAAAYCFGLYFSKHVIINIDKKYVLEFMAEYEDYFGLDMETMCSCILDNLKYPQYYYSFSAEKIRAFNKRHNQTSVIDTINRKDADDYWYEVAVKGRFKEND